MPTFYFLSVGLGLNFENEMLGKHVSFSILGKFEDGGDLEGGENDGASIVGCQVQLVSYEPETQVSDDEGMLGVLCSAARPDVPRVFSEGVWSELSDTYSSWS